MAVAAVAPVAELSVGEAVAVQLEALRLGAVAGFARPHAQLEGTTSKNNINRLSEEYRPFNFGK